MAVAIRKTLDAFHRLSMRDCTLNHPTFAYNIRRLSHNSFESRATSPNDGSMTDSSEFVKWHNGGGLCHRSAHVDPTVLIEIGAVVHPNSVLGADVCVGSGAIVGPSVSIGQSSKVGYNAVLCNSSVGLSCIIHNGVCIGKDGFGFFVDEEGRVVKKPQVLRVSIGNHVEIGANTCIDRGSWRDTVIGDHSKIDNLVQIAHNVVIGKCCMLCGQVGVAGSVTIGDYTTLGGRVAIRDHVSIASKVRLAANSCVTKDIGEPGDYGGFPAVSGEGFRPPPTSAGHGEDAIRLGNPPASPWSPSTSGEGNLLHCGGYVRSLLVNDCRYVSMLSKIDRRGVSGTDTYMSLFTCFKLIFK